MIGRVGELLQALQALPADLPLFLAGPGGGYQVVSVRVAEGSRPVGRRRETQTRAWLEITKVEEP